MVAVRFMIVLCASAYLRSSKSRDNSGFFLSSSNPEAWFAARKSSLPFPSFRGPLTCDVS